jgi:alpha-methylacyl-CoA racemase
MRQRLAALFATRTRDEWVCAFDGVDACVTPVLGVTEPTGHPHNLARGLFTSADGVGRPAPAPRFSRTPAAVPGRQVGPPLACWGLPAGQLDALVGLGIVVPAD